MFSLFRKKQTQAPAHAADGSSSSEDGDVLERIVPVIKVAGQDDVHHSALPEDDSPISRAFAGDLIVMYAEDLPDRFVYLSRKRVSKLGLDVDALHDLAVQNLARRAPKIKRRGDAPCYMITAGGNVEATLLLHPTLWESLADHLPGEPIALVPARDLLIVTSSEWEDGRATLRNMARRKLPDQRYALSKLLFVRRNGSWTVDGLES